MSATRKIVFVSTILGILASTAGCPTLPGQVSGASTGDAPGDQIEWETFQVDPAGENTAGFNQVVSADLNDDGLVDLVTAAYESQPIQIHLQQRSPDGAISFQSMSIAGSGPIVRVSELRVVDVDQDGNLDIIVSSQDNGFAFADECAAQQCSILILFAPPDPSDTLLWVEYNLTRNFRCVFFDGVTDTFSTPGFDGNELCYSSLDVGDANADGFPDILAAFNGCDEGEFPTKRVELWINPANERIRENEVLLGAIETDLDQDGFADSCNADVDSPWKKVILQQDFVDISSVRFSDVDLDTDLDVVALRPTSKTFDITWQSNPLIPSGGVETDFWGGTVTGRVRPIGESDAGFDFVEIGDLDGDGFEDVLAVGQADRLLRWFHRPKDPAAQDFPWDVFNMVQFTELIPTAVDIADVDNNGQLDVVAAAGGRIRWFTPLGQSPFEPWSEQFVANDPMIPDGGGASSGAPFPPINSIHAVDIDADGRLDIAATLDREGVNNDLVAWFLNRERESE